MVRAVGAFGDLLRSLAGPRGRAEAVDDDADPGVTAIQRAIEQRIASFTLGDALALPAVARAVDLICSHAAALQPIVLADGLPLDRQPRLVTRPTPWAGETRHDFVYSTVHSLLAGEPRGGNAYWLTIDRDDHGLATSLLLLPPADVSVSWDEMRLRRRYRWRGQAVDAADVTHVRIGARAGELLGRSPLIDWMRVV
jgi:phage portal protein BeeE